MLKKIISALLGAIAILVVLFVLVDMDQVRLILEQVNFRLVGIALLFLIFGFVLSFLRWYWLLDAMFPW